MPNYCHQALNVRGSKEEMRKFYQDNGLPVPIENASNFGRKEWFKIADFLRNTKDWTVFCMATGIYPHYKSVPFKSRAEIVFYSFANGAPLSFFSTRAILEELTIEPTHFRVVYDSKWDSLLSWLKTIFPRYNNLRFEFAWLECGMDFGGEMNEKLEITPIVPSEHIEHIEKDDEDVFVYSPKLEAIMKRHGLINVGG